MMIVSGGQTGADRAALDFAIEHGLAHGGWCPRGRLAEDGPIDERYDLEQTPSRKYAIRTEWNVRDSDATVIFTIARAVSGGTALTASWARRLRKPLLHLSRDSLGVDPGAIESASALLRQFIEDHAVAKLNVAGPRASQEPEIAAFVRAVLQEAFCDC